MCYARRQRSSWARIKLSSKLYLNRLRLKSFVELVWLFILCWVCLESVIDSRFLFQRNFEIFALSFACTLISCCSIVNDLPEPGLCLPRFARPCYYSTSVSLCQEVFENFFWKFFAAFCLGRKCFDIISHSLPFVKRFFKSFLTFFVIFCPAVWQPAVAQLAYYSTSLPFCQALFDKFFLFGGLGISA